MRHWSQVSAVFQTFLLAIVLLSPSVTGQESQAESANPPDASNEDFDETDETIQVQELSSQDQIRIRAICERLNADEFQEREQATADLIREGDLALPLLKQLQTETSNPEASARLKLIIDRIETSGLPKRIDAFMAAPADTKAHGFYGWPEFAAIAGSNRVARRLFIQLLDRHARLCNESLNIDQLNTLQIDVVKTLKEIRRSTGETTIADAIVLQYLMIRLGKSSSEELERLTADLIKFAPYSRELNLQEGTSTLKRITGKWMTTVQRDMISPLIVSLNYRMKEGAIVAREILKNGPADEITYNVAMQTLLVFGDQEDLALVESFFENKTIVFRENDFANGLMIEIQQQYRDLALAAAVHIRGLKMTDYFAGAQPHHLRGYNPTTLRFLGPDPDLLRDAAFERYRQSVNAPQRVD